MAQITIPRQIGGVNLPSFNFSDNPLIGLFGAEKDFFLQYPRDLGSDSKAHSVIFTIYEVQEYTLGELENMAGQVVQMASDKIGDGDFADSIGDVLGGAVDIGSNILNKMVDVYNNGIQINRQEATMKIQSGISSGIDWLRSGGNLLSEFGQVMTAERVNRIGNIALYMPENFNISNAFNYDDSTSVASAAGAIPLLGKYINRGTNFISGSNDLARLIFNKGGFVFNPQKQILFNGVEFRNFSMSFTFTPYSEKENIEIREIIKQLRMYAAPKANNQLGEGMFWVPPALFEIDFKFHDKHNVNLPKLKRCVIKDIDVNYAPSGWAAHGDGAPVQTVVTIEFQETSLISRDDIGGGY